MPYGPDNSGRMSVGTLELLGQKSIVSREGELELGDDDIGSQATWATTDDADLEDAVDAARNARIVIMNPPFTNRANMGEKFPKETQNMLRARADSMEQILIQADTDLAEFVDKNSIAPLFVAVADHSLEQENGVLTMVHPTIALSNPSGHEERRILAQRFHIHTVLTSHQPQNINMSQHTSINESIVVMRRHAGHKQPTRFINLDRMPVDDAEIGDFYRCLLDCKEGLMENGWGEVSYWPAERIEAGDWTAAIWRSSCIGTRLLHTISRTILTCSAIGDNPNCLTAS